MVAGAAKMFFCKWQVFEIALILALIHDKAVRPARTTKIIATIATRHDNRRATRVKFIM